jgi:hypothetical protein
MKTVSRVLKVSCIFAAALCLTGLSSAQAQVLSQVPSDALVVLRINKISDTNTKVAGFLQTLGLTDLVPTLKDPLESIENQSGMGAGIDTKRDAAAVIINGTFDKEKDNAPPVVMLVPVSDYKAFLGSVTVVRTEGDVTVAHFKDSEEDAFIESWGDYAAISNKKENITVKHEGLTLKGIAAKQMSEKDLCIYFNFPALKPLILPQLKDVPDKAMEQVGKTETDPAKLKVTKTVINQLVAAATEFVNDADDVTVGIDIKNEGISSNMVVELMPESYLGKLSAMMKSTDGPLLTGLPKENYLMFGGFVSNTQATGKVFDDLVNPVIKELAGMGDDGKRMTDAVDGYRDAMTALDSFSIGVVAPTAALMQGPMIRMLSVGKGDVEKYKAAQAKMIDGENQIMGMSGLGGGGGDLFKLTKTPDFKTIDGVKFDRLQMEVNPDNTSQEAMKMNQQMSMMYGPDGARFLLGTLDSHTLITGLGVDDDLLGQAIDLVKDNKDVLTDDLKLVDAGLPKNRGGVFYLGLDQILATGINYAKANGVPVPIQLPNNLPPIGFTFGTDGPNMHYDMFIPTKLMQSLVQAGGAIFQQFNNRGGGGGGL